MRPLVCAIGLLVAGCFTESEPMGQSCPPKTAGCACGDGPCNEGLECREPGVCVEPSCTPGTAGCLCDAGTCDQGLICNELGACVLPMGGGTDTTATSASGSSGATATTDTSSGTSSPTTTSETTSNGDTSTGPGETTGPTYVCGKCLEGGALDSCLESSMCGSVCEGAALCLGSCASLGMSPDECGTMCCAGKGVDKFFGCIDMMCNDCQLPDICVSSG